jgi:F-type H+-transporting ATPase subunit alpha
VTELLKQPQYQPLQVWELSVALFAANKGYLDDLEVKDVLPFEKGLREFLKAKYAELIARIEDKKDLTKDDEAILHTALKDCKKSGAY